MKIRTTKKEIVNGYRYVIQIPYCDLWYLLNRESPIAYTCGVYGWNADIYYISDNIAICTGYRSFGNIKPDFATIKEYNQKAKAIFENIRNYEEQTERLQALMNEFINLVVYDIHPTEDGQQ